MKNISLPNKDLRILSLQIQSFQQGYTVEQIRLLDSVISSINKVLEPFDTKINEFKAKPKNEENDEELNKFFDIEGSKIVTCEFEDAHFDFIKKIWDSMGNLSGQEIARREIIVIDDALKAVSNPVFK